MVRKMTADDWPAVRAIYEEGLATGDATFEQQAPSWESWDAGHLQSCRLVAEDEGGLLGWAALSAVSGRCVYGGVAEVSVYVAESERNGMWTLQAGIFPENAASVALHERCGFRIVGRRERLGRMNGRWRDVLLLERRSPVIT